MLMSKTLTSMTIQEPLEGFKIDPRSRMKPLTELVGDSVRHLVRFVFEY